MKRVNLALQGGGAHGAFTWGTLDRLLDETDIEVDMISATSAGAMNAVAFKTGWVEGERDGARDRLKTFWDDVVAAANVVPDPFATWFGAINPSLPVISHLAEANPAYLAGGLLSRTFSPYDTNPANLNPLRQIVEGFAFDCLDKEPGPQVHIAATNVRTGKIKIFTRDAITTDSILASACLPTMYQAVEIENADGTTDAYWDGGYMGNPALFPLFSSPSQDILIVHINPIYRPDIPKTAREIENRVNEISFNATLLRELRAIDFVTRMLETGGLADERYKRLNIHSVADDETMRQIGVATKLSPTRALVDNLFEAGRAAMDGFLSRNKGDLGERSSCDLRAMFE